MKLGRDDVFKAHEPPAGGLAKLRARLDESRATRSTRLVWGLATAGAVAVTLILWLFVPPSTERATSETTSAIEQQIVLGAHPAFVGMGLSAAPKEPVTSHPSSHDTIVERLPSQNQQVIIYLVASTQ